jgi:phosphatidylinositol alpha-1,6-mannosyltransferase
VTDLVISFDWGPKIGGAHLWLYEVYKRWPTAVSVLTTASAPEPKQARREEAFDRLPHGSLETYRRANPIPVIGLANPSCWLQFLRNARIAGRIAGAGVATIHCLRAFPEGYIGLLAKRASPLERQLVTYAHGEEVLVARSSRLLNWMARRVYAASDLVIANSESTRNLVVELCPTARIRVIHPGVDVEAFGVPESERQAFRGRLPWANGTVVFSTVARMERRKNQGAVIVAAAELTREGVPVGYICAGEGQEREALEALARERGVVDRVWFPGAVSDEEKRLIYAASDVHVMPSVRVGEMIEGFGIVFLEAAAAGVPSVSGNSGGQAEAVIDNRTGLVVDGGDPAQLVAALRTLATAVEMRREMGRQARAWAAEHDWRAVRDRTLAALASIR